MFNCFLLLQIALLLDPHILELALHLQFYYDQEKLKGKLRKNTRIIL